jgi:Glycosyltransferase 61
MFLSCSPPKVSLSRKSPWVVFGILALLLLRLYPVNQLFVMKKRLHMGMPQQILEKPMLAGMAQEIQVSSSIATTKEMEPTMSPSAEVGMPEILGRDPQDTSTAWCILDHNNTNQHFRHFPHALQSLAPCWSFFCREREERGAHVSCGIYIQYPPRVPWNSMSSWTRQLVEHMDCYVVVQSKENTPLGDVIADGDVQYRPPDQHVKSYRFFEKQAHVQQLQRKVLGDALETNPATKKKGAIQIGLLQRIRNSPKQASRIFLNLPNIRSQLQVAFPEATLVETDMRDFSLLEQALWWHQNDVVVAAHGAAITNCIFLRNHNASASTVIEIYPDGFHPIIFGALMKSVGVHRLNIDRNASISVGKNADLQPEPKLVVQLVREALQGSDWKVDRKAL